ncbi:palmdelphin [Latimeria chalumnae]|uniref:palmdelphin n=1 Tax=Latimeria chalumnae TaxID=7897 RepID=UPI0003C12CC7|nr:PREDICTED: palmdelphin [Latimeria chalumnae]XP_006000063.1 PREDICTED: palmdelphin [Latimeria chalumnae]XP_006000064.1 PREDICTED: palmdelphin [Latimeria chalumnae]XP_014346258.1 PREDICTED: palmdelphin [Latimeria chalumnae]|eukprot:XP_006000062.1 PREDICTED: palmdelphin [Latimeria chalumnae]
MEEAELLKERLQAITDKRKLQEEIAKQRHQVEEEKMKLHHLKKKTLREKWLFDGLTALTSQEQEEMQNKNEKDQQQTKLLEQNIFRLEKEIEYLEKQEMQVSVNEEAILEKLKAVETTPEDIIKAVKIESQEESIEYIYSKIPELPKSYKPSALKGTENQGEEAEEDEDDETKREALFAMEINVEKDVKTGESTVLSTMTIAPEDFKDKGIKVYDDGIKSVHAVCSDKGTMQNGVDELTPVEVEDLLRKATEKKSKSPTEYHEPVYSSPFTRPTTPKILHREQFSPGPKAEAIGKEEMDEEQKHSKAKSFLAKKVDIDPDEDNSFDHQQKEMETSQFSRLHVSGCSPYKTNHHQSMPTQNNDPQATQNDQQPTQIQDHEIKENHREAVFLNSEFSNERSSAAFEEDVKYSIVDAMPCNTDTEPVTMIFMGYQNVDYEDENNKVSSYEGAIRAELVVIDDDDDEEEEILAYHPEGHYSQIYQPSLHLDTGHKLSETRINQNMNNCSPQGNSTSLQEQEASLNHALYKLNKSGYITGDGTEDPSLTALRMRMAKLGKRVM